MFKKATTESAKEDRGGFKKKRPGTPGKKKKCHFASKRSTGASIQGKRVPIRQRKRYGESVEKEFAMF